jgi:predicted CXXCH cytochrome family protein
MNRIGEHFYVDTADPGWAERMAESGKPPAEWGPAKMARFSVDRLVGSHWFQECMHKDRSGRYLRLPLSYHLVENRWIHTNGAFLAPDVDSFWDKSTVWNETCVFCHNTRVSKRPWRSPFGEAGYQTEVAELGISCEACHGPGGEHVRANANPARRLALQHDQDGDPTIVNPRRLPPARADQICGHCHGSLVPRKEAWDLQTVADPYLAGQDLTRSYFVFWSEDHQQQLHQEQRPSAAPPPSPLDGRFWGDGTPLTTALEYQGMALSACYQGGHGQLSCQTCHDMHPAEPNFMLRPRMDTNEACLQCHGSYREHLAEHTHHAADSAGSLCYNCHQPYTVFSLLTTHRSHRIERPRVRDSLGTGKPHACNLCHLDKSLGWTQDRLTEWYGVAPEALTEEERQVASSLLLLFKNDARSRVVVAGAFSWPPAQQASGTDWQGPLLARLLEHERYPAVRYLAHRGLRSLYGRPTVEPYDYLALPNERSRQLETVRARLEGRPRPDASRYPYLPLTEDGTFKGAALDALLRQRNDPDVTIHE